VSRKRRLSSRRGESRRRRERFERTQKIQGLRRLDRRLGPGRRDDHDGRRKYKRDALPIELSESWQQDIEHVVVVAPGPGPIVDRAAKPLDFLRSLEPSLLLLDSPLRLPKAPLSTHVR